MQAGAEIAQAFAAGAQQERRDGAFLGEHHAVKALVRLGEFGEAARGLEVEGAAVHQYAADRRAVAAEEFGGRVIDEVGAVLERFEQVRRGEGGVDQQRHAVLMRDLRDGGDIEHVEAWIAERFAEQQARVRAQRGAPCGEVAAV